MEQTSRLRIIIDASNAERSINNLKTGLQGLQDQAQNAVSALSRLQNNSLGGLVRSSGAVNQLNQNVRQTQNIFNQTNNVLNRTSNVFNQVNNTVNRTNNSFTRMGDTINRNTTIINNYNNSVNRTSSSLSNLNGVLSGTILGSLTQLHGLLTGSIFAMAGLSVLKTADAMQSLDSQIKLVTKSEEEYLTVRQKVREIADKNYADIEATTNLYQNSARALANLGKTQQEALVFTNAVSLAMRTGGKSALEQKSALYQLGQAMQSGVLNGDEFRSISENAPILLDLVAKKLNVTRGEVKALASDGKITSQVIYETLATATPKLEEMAKKMPITMGQAFALVRNKYKEFIGDFMNNDTGLSGVIAKSLVVASNHFNTFAKVAVAGAGVAMLGLTNRILTSGKAMTTLATIMKTHPIFAMTSVVMAVSTANRGLEATLDDLGKSLSMVGLMIKDTVNLFSELGSTAYQIFRDITSNAQDTTQTSSQLFGGFFSDTGSGFTGLMHGTAKTFDAMATTVKTFGKFAGENLAYFVTNVGDLFKIMANNTAHIFENIVNNVVGKSVNFIIEKINGVLEFSNSLSEKLGIEPMALLEPYQSNIKFGRFNVGRMTRTRTWAELFDESAEEQMRNGALSWTQSLEHRANATIPNASLNNPMGEYQKPKDKDKDKKKKDDKKYTYTQSELQQLQHVQKLIYGTNLSDGKTLAWHAEQAGLPPERLAGLMMQESKGIAHNKSHTGAYGYFQFTGNYRKDWGVSYKQGADLEIAGKTVIKSLTHAFKELGNWDDAILSHNAGIGGARLLRNKGKVKGTPERQKEVKEFVPKNAKWTAYFAGKNLSDKTKTLSQEGRKFYQNQSEQDEKIKQSQQEIQSWFATERQKRDDEFIKKTNEIITNFSGDEQTRLLNQLTDQFLKVNRYADLKFELDTKGDVMGKWERLAKELDVRLAGIDADMTLSEEQREAQKEQAHREQLKKSSEIMLAEKQEYLDLNRWRMSYREVLKLEKDIAIERLNIGRTVQEIQANGLTKEQQAIQDQYDFKIEQYNKEQRLKIAELEKTNQAVRQSGHYAGYLDELNKKTMGKPVYERWKMNNHYGQIINDEQSRYTDLKEQIEAKDDTGNYVIEDALERHRLLQEAEKAHQNEMQAIREKYAEESHQIEVNRHKEQMGLYQQALSLASGVWDNMTDIVKGSLGEQSTAYKVMFGFQKSIAIAQAILNTEQAVTKALAEGGAIMGVPMASLVRATGYASIGLMASQSIAQMAGFATGGYTGDIGTSQIAGVVHGQEYVLNAQATKRIGVNNLNRLNNGDGIGGGVNVIINNHSNEKATAQQMPNGDVLVTIGKMIDDKVKTEVRQQFIQESRQGGMIYRNR